MGLRYLILGSGRQGTAAGYDLAVHGDADRVTFTDVDLARATAAAARVNRLAGRSVSQATAIDLEDAAAQPQLLDLLGRHDAALGAAGYHFNLQLTDLALRAGVHFADLGGSTEIVQAQRERDEQARAAGVYIVPDCGLAPGAVNQLAAYLLERFPTLTSVHLYCGGLPVHPRPPLYYQLVFHIQGLTLEYRGAANYLRDGKIVQVPALTELERLEFPAVGELEAFVTSGGTSTAPWTYQDRLRDYTYKTLRWPGHFAIIRALADLGFLSPEPVLVKGQSVAPLDMFHELVPRALTGLNGDTFVAVAARAQGPGLRADLWLRVDDDPETGFRAMERATGYSAALVLATVAGGRAAVGPGVVSPERVMSGSDFVAGLKARGIEPALQVSGPLPDVKAERALGELAAVS